MGQFYSSSYIIKELESKIGDHHANLSSLSEVEEASNREVEGTLENTEERIQEITRENIENYNDKQSLNEVQNPSLELVPEEGESSWGMTGIQCSPVKLANIFSSPLLITQREENEE